MAHGGNRGIRMLGLACVLLASCGPRAAGPPSGRCGGLPAKGRDWVEQYGRREAVARMDAALGARDQSHGVFERRFGEACADKSKILPGSMATLPLAERKQTGVYLVLGFQKSHGRSPPIIREAAAQLAARGFRARVIEAPDRQTACAGARQIEETLAAELPHVRRAVVVGFSKGSADLTQFWLGPARELPASQRRKIKLWINCAGVLQGSEVAHWLACQSGWKPGILRGFINLATGSPSAGCDDLASIAGDPWHTPGNHLPPGTRGHLLCIDVAVLPDGPDGWPTTDRLFRLIGTSASRDRVRLGPCDGLVESAAAVLPDGTGLREWIVRIRGSHALLDGYHRNGLPVAPAYAQGAKARLTSGTQLLNDIMRVIPADP
jgi:hypothetical protein